MNNSDDQTTGLFAGRYALEKQIGSGGTAIVHLARDVSTGQLVAIKMLRAELAESVSAQRFLREISVTASLSHENILPVLDSGEFEGTLFFVLPYMDGGTLRDRLQKEKQLPVAEVIAIGCAVADALVSAHKRQLLHRDVKPENILFSDGKAYLADFGIARALEHASSYSTTTTGLVRGTPAYMSPEQASGEREYDGRSDLYSLACVLYEAIAGVAPFVGPTVQAIVSQRLVHAPRPLHVYRPTVPIAVKQVLERALAVTPADRFLNIGEFAAALRAADISSGQVRTVGGKASVLSRRESMRVAMQNPRTRILTIVAALALVATLAFGWRTLTQLPTVFGGVALDSTRYAVILADGDSSASFAMLEELVRERITEWRDISAAESFRVREAAARKRGNPRRAAMDIGAGRYIRIDVAPSNDSLRIQGALYETGRDSVLIERTIRTARDGSGAHDAVKHLTDTLLLRGGLAHGRVESGAGTQSLFARQSYGRAFHAIAAWNLAEADSQLALALRSDAEYAEASVWLAHVRSWQVTATETWAPAATAAAAARDRLPPYERVLSDALVLLRPGSRTLACSKFRELVAAHQSDYAAWFSLGRCLRYDDAVVADSKSSTGWRFVSSYNRAIDAYEHAFELNVAILSAFRDGSFRELHALLKTTTNRIREGNSGAFQAFASWSGDSLAFFPQPLAVITASAAETRNASVNEAILHQRQRLHRMARMWRSRATGASSAYALEAVAVALDLLGNGTAVDSLRLARQMAVEDNDQLRMAALEVWMRVKASVPRDTTGLRMARLLADSVLRLRPPGMTSEPRVMAGLSALTGRAGLAAQYAQMPGGVGIGDIPPSIAVTAPQLLAAAAMGGPADTIRVLLVRLQTSIDLSVPSEDRAAERSAWLPRVALLAFDRGAGHIGGDVAAAREKGDLLSLVAAWKADSTELTKAILERRRVTRVERAVLPPYFTTDILYGEAAMLASIGEVQRARGMLEATLTALPVVVPQLLSDVAFAGPLVRCMALEADLLHGQGDVAGARVWANVVLTLWSGADEFLQNSVVRQMKEIAR